MEQEEVGEVPCADSPRHRRGSRAGRALHALSATAGCHRPRAARSALRHTRRELCRDEPGPHHRAAAWTGVHYCGAVPREGWSQAGAGASHI